MGGAASARRRKSIEEEVDELLNPGIVPKKEWRLTQSVEEAQGKYLKQDGILLKNASHIECRTLLDEPLAQRALGMYAKQVKAMEIFMCWSDIQEFKTIPTDDYRISKALHIYHKYIKPGAILALGAFSVSEREEYKTTIDAWKANRDMISDDVFSKVQSVCFMEIYSNIYCRFCETESYARLKEDMKMHYNVTTVDDFEYLRKLGEGAFGLVLHCRKKSTGIHYAMKVQTKKGLLECFYDEPSRVDYEKQAFAALQHPFIVNIDYAFQTPSLAIMVLGLAEAGDLQKVLQNSDLSRLDEDRVRFYSAEILLALGHLHSMGMLYRDLKPGNVLLCSTGHIMLVDLGGVVDERGLVLTDRHQDDPLGLTLFAQRYEKACTEAAALLEAEGEAEATEENGEEAAPKRRLSIMGTFGYMAPEMVVMMTQRSCEKVGYTKAVDYWSLGVTVYKLLTGDRPFSDRHLTEFMDMSRIASECGEGVAEYTMLFQEIFYPEYLSEDAVDFIKKLLNVDPKERLGAGPSGLEDAKKHPYFRGIDWNLLQQKHVVPPFIPPVKPAKIDDHFVDFETIMSKLGKSKWLRELPDPNDDRYFAAWDFADPRTLKIEFGISHEMEQYDKSFKVRKLLGSMDS